MVKHKLSAEILQSCEKIRLSLENCEVEKDITNFIQERGTGQEIPDPPRYINFCRGDVNDSASEASDDEAYSVAQFQRTINPAFRSSSPQPSTYESHHDPQSDLAIQMGAHHDPNTPASRENTLTPQKTMSQPPPALDYRRRAQPQAPVLLNQQGEIVIPHNEYPTEGMTMFCRTDVPPSERSSVRSPVRPSSRDSQSEYSNPTSFSSLEPTSGKVSPTKQMLPPAAQPISPEKQVQKKRSGFFSNSPFRRKSKHEKDSSRPISMAPPVSRNGWGALNTGSNNPSPTRPGTATRDFANQSHSPEPVDPRANFQLNVGPNVFDVASPDVNRHRPASALAPAPSADQDPIAAALAELKGVTKQSSTRVSADRYHGIATPGPGTPGAHNSAVAAAKRGTPPPGYHDQPMSRLDAPKPAFTSAQMQQTTRKYVGQNQDMYGGSRPGTSGGMPRAASPLPLRSTSPRPGFSNQVQSGYGSNDGRSASPNPYGNSAGLARPRQSQPQSQSQGNSPVKQGYGSTNGSMDRYSRHTSPNDVRRAVSPQPQFARPERPSSSSGGMALQLSNGGGQMESAYAGSHRGRGDGVQRPVSYYGGGAGAGAGVGAGDAGARARSKSVVDARQFTREGRPIVHFGKSDVSSGTFCTWKLGKHVG